MKYFTPELISAYGSDDSTSWQEVEDRWEAMGDRYNAYLRSIQDAFPVGLSRLEHDYFLHDAVVQGMGIHDGKLVFVLRLDPPPQPLVMVTYELVEAPTILPDVLPAECRSGGSHVDWQYDEIEAVSGEPRTWLQSILLSNGWEVCLHFRDVKVEELQALLPVPRNGSTLSVPPVPQTA
jgi:hypothetical protein